MSACNNQKQVTVLKKLVFQNQTLNYTGGTCVLSRYPGHWCVYFNLFR